MTILLLIMKINQYYLEMCRALKGNNISVINSSSMQRAGGVAGLQKREFRVQYQGEVREL